MAIQTETTVTVAIICFGLQWFTDGNPPDGYPLKKMENLNHLELH